MSQAAIDQVRADFNRLLASSQALYQSVADERGGDDAATAQLADGERRDRLVRATELIEVLESVTFDRIRRLRP